MGLWPVYARTGLHPVASKTLIAPLDLRVTGVKKASLTLSLLLASVFSLNAETPNVVMLLADDLGVQDIGCYDGPVKTSRSK